MSATAVASDSLSLSVVATNRILGGNRNIIAESSSSGGLLDAALHFPGFWSVCIMLVIVGLLVAWESSIEWLRENTPPTIQPVIDKVLGEIGGLGFIGLVLSTFVLDQQLGLGHSIGGLSETYLGDEEILLETFEFLHEVFFQTAIVYFVSTAFVVTNIVSNIYFITTLTEEKAAAECEPGSIQNGNLPIEAYEAFLRIEEGTTPPTRLNASDETREQSSNASNNNNNNNSRWQRELGLTREERGAEILVIRERLIREGLVGGDSGFTIRSYIEDLFSSDEFEFVELSPLSWVPLIPGLALLSSVDLAHDVLPNGQNSYESCGYFVSTPWVILPIVASQILCLVWAIYNFKNMASIKTMLVPRVFRKDNSSSSSSSENDRGFEIVRPDVEVPELRREFQQSMASDTPLVFRPIESYFGSRPTNRVQELFGTVGGNGKGFFLDSIKFQLWLTVSSIVCLGNEILTRDVLALVANNNPGDASIIVGNPDSLVVETLVFGLFLALNVLELLSVPTTFLNYCLIDTVETFVDKQGGENREVGEIGTLSVE